MDKTDVIKKEYEMMYIDTAKKNLSNLYFRGLTRERQQLLALEVIRFAVENYLRWEPEDVARYMSREVLDKMRLSSVVKRYIDFPVEYSKEYELTYLCYLLYPDVYHLDMEEQVMHLYGKIMNGELANFPSQWMESDQGIMRFQIIFCYVLSGLRYSSIEDAYRDFASPEGPKIMKKYKIYNFATKIFPDVFSAFHYSLPEYDDDGEPLRNDFLFNYLQFERSRKKQQSEKKKAEKLAKKGITS